VRGRPEALSADWLGASRRATAELRRILREYPTSRQRVEETGSRGEGGDQTLVIDQAAEDAIFAELDRLSESGARFSALSEERGLVDFGSEDVLVVIDPIDGSMNAKRGLTHHAISIGVAAGNTMGDMEFGYVFDFGPDEEWVARRGEGVLLNGDPLPEPPPPRHDDGRLELVAIESADPRWIAKRMDELLDHVHRVRAMGTIAVSLCQVAQTRVDGMATLWKTRSVDAAAAQLIVRESGGLVAFTAMGDPLGAPLDLEPRSPVVAARNETTLGELSTLPAANHDGMPR
jgi:myo-inositol-1(or 4)-monophosphatase